MINITFLGTSGSAPTKARGLPSMALRYEGSVILFDCGEGTQRQMMEHSVNPSSVDAIFLTHIHGDHTIGLAGLVRTMALNRRERALLVCIPKGFGESLRSLITFDGAMLPFKINITEITPGWKYDGKGYTVKAFALRHSVPTCGYLFKENDKLHFLKGKAKKLGVRGKMFSELEAKGHITVAGKRISISEITTKTKGLSVAYASDTRPCTETVKASSGANLLVHESTYAEEESALAHERAHSTAKGAALIAKRAKVEKLALMHFSARYKLEGKLLKEAREIFRNTVAAKDGMRLTLK